MPLVGESCPAERVQALRVPCPLPWLPSGVCVYDCIPCKGRGWHSRRWRTGCHARATLCRLKRFVGLEMVSGSVAHVAGTRQVFCESVEFAFDLAALMPPLWYLLLQAPPWV